VSQYTLTLQGKQKRLLPYIMYGEMDKIEMFSTANERMTVFVPKQCCHANCLKFVTEQQKSPAADSLDFNIWSLFDQLAELAYWLIATLQFMSLPPNRHQQVADCIVFSNAVQPSINTCFV